MNLEDNEIYKILSQKIKPDLVKDLLNTYDSVQKEYYDDDNESTLSKSGKFVENVFRILHYIVTSEVLSEIKEGQLTKIFNEMEKADSSKFSDTIRLVIPRVGMTIYTMRSKLGSEHVKPTVPDFIDAKFTISSCDWIISELLRSYYDRDPSKIQELLQNIKSKKSRTLSSFETELAVKIDNLAITEIVAAILRAQSPQSRATIIETLKKIGRDVSTWFRAGNMEKTLVKRGLAIKEGID